MNISIFSTNEPDAVATEALESSDQLTDNTNVNKLCVAVKKSVVQSILVDPV